jgi:glycosyltransferase involved in cell wall biosynthesis
MNYAPSVSVCIAVYNGALFIERGVQSALNQTFQNFEIIIINDGSTDDTLTVINQFTDSRIKIYSNTANQGASYTRNRYLSLAIGEFIAILDADDTWSPDKLQKQLDFFSKNPEYGLCGTFARRIYSDGSSQPWHYPTTDTAIRYRLIWGSAIIHSSLMIKSTLLKNISYNESLNQAEDYDLIRRIVAVTKVANINQELVSYFIHSEQLTHKDNQGQIGDAVKVSKMYLEENLQSSFDDFDYAIVAKVFRYAYPLKLDELERLHEVFLLLSNNEKLGHSKQLKKLFDQKWLEVLTQSSNNDISIFRLYLQTQSTKDLFRLKTFKLLLKCLIK